MFLGTVPVFSIMGRTPPTILSTNYDQIGTGGGGGDIVLTGLNMLGVTSVDHGGSSITPSGVTATTVTYAAPAKSAGTYSVTCTGPGGTSNSISIESWHLNLLNLDGYWEDSYNSGTGNMPVDSSAGASGSNGAFTQGLSGQRPDTDTTVLNGLNAPDFVPANDDFLENSNTLDTFINSSRYWEVALFTIDAFTSNSGAINQNAPIINDTGGFYGLYYSGSGSSGTLWAYHSDSTEKAVSASISTGTRYLAVRWFDGSNINFVVNGSTKTPVAAGNVIDVSNTMKMGRNYTLDLTHDGAIGALAISSSAYGATEALKTLKYFRQRYSIALT